MKNVLIVSGHTDLSHDSVVNKTIIEELKRQLPHAELDILSDLYPNFQINAATEQEKLRKADIIVLQFPVFWFSMPSIMHKWFEDVFVHGFSHGSTGTVLHGKKLIASFTTGAPLAVYVKDGAVGYTLEEIMGSVLRPLAGMCGMELLPFVSTGSVSYADRNDKEAAQSMHKRSLEHAGKVVKLIKQNEK